MIKFINRRRELSFLRERFRSGRAELILVYGRRRVGKTYLFRRFMEEVGGIYVIVRRDGREMLNDFSRALSEILGFEPRIEDYRELYRVLGGISGERLLVVIDEFQRLAERDPSFLADLQAAWDEYLSRSRIMLVLMGSSVGTMERVGLSESSPIYGRRTGALRLSPFRFSCAKEFLKTYGMEDIVRAYSIFGGVPAYLAMVDPSLSLLENIHSLIVREGAPLREEPIFLLSQETREPIRYMSILEAMASGSTRLSEIASRSGMRATELPRYMTVLERDLNLVRREYPLLEAGKRGKARYLIADNFFRFWFRFLYPNWDLVEMGRHERLMGLIQRDLDLHTSEVFENVAKEHFIRDQDVEKVGRWWKGEVEIDLVGIRRDPPLVVFAEVKWSSKPVGREILNSLIRKAAHFPWRRERREEKYVLYSRSGFSFSTEEAKLVDLREIVGMECLD